LVALSAAGLVVWIRIDDFVPLPARSDGWRRGFSLNERCALAAGTIAIDARVPDFFTGSHSFFTHRLSFPLMGLVGLDQCDSSESIAPKSFAPPCLAAAHMAASLDRTEGHRVFQTRWSFLFQINACGPCGPNLDARLLYPEANGLTEWSFWNPSGSDRRDPNTLAPNRVETRTTRLRPSSISASY